MAPCRCPPALAGRCVWRNKGRADDPGVRGGRSCPTIEHVQRWAEPFVDELLDEEPAILLEGPRGSGKSTLLRSIAKRRGALVLDPDDDSVLQLVREDVGTSLASPGLVAIDEFHRAPEVLSYVKRVVDREGGAGWFLLAGSVSSFLLPPGTETLTGRAHRLSLMPLAAAETFGAKHRWPAELLAGGEPRNFRSCSARRDYLRNLEVVLSASTLPPVWQVGQ